MSQSGRRFSFPARDLWGLFLTSGDPPEGWHNVYFDKYRRARAAAEFVETTGGTAEDYRKQQSGEH